MSEIKPKRYNAWLAGICAIVPGGGQVYNGQLGKAVLIVFSIIFSFLYFLFGPRIGFSDWLGYGHDRFLFFSYTWIEHEGNELFEAIRFLVLLLLIPFIYLFGIVDAVLSARRLNRTPAPLGAVSGGATMSSQDPNVPNQEELRMQANSTMGHPSAGTTTGPPPNPGPGAPGAIPNQPGVGAQDTPSPPPEDIEQRRQHGRLIFGLVLLAVGSAFLLSDVFPRFSVFDLWPAIPLMIGIMILNDYRIQRDTGRLVLGSFFAGIGLLFGLEEWTWLEPFEWMEWSFESMVEYWYLILIAIGGLLVLQELTGARHKRRKRNNTKSTEDS